MPHPTCSFSRRGLLGSGLALAALPFQALAQGPVLRDPQIAALLGLFEPDNGPTGRAAYHASWLSTAGQRRWPLVRFDQVFGEIAHRSGGFDFLAADRRDTTIWLTVRARRQQVERTLRVRVDREDPTRIFDILAAPTPTPYPDAQQQGQLASAELPALVERRIGFSVTRDEFSGVCRIVAPSGEIAYEAAFGMSSRAPDRANTTETRFHLGSADKSFTALLLGKLVADRRLGFDTGLDQVLPEYPNVDFARACTMRHLLSHSAGLGILFNRPAYDGNRAFSRMAEILPAFAAEPPAFAPGTDAAYSNEGFIVLGAVIERVTGQSWYELLDLHIYRPAGMAASGHFLQQDLPEKVAVGYRYLPNDHLGLSPRLPNHDFRGYRGNSCGGGYSTVADMTSYLRALRNGDLLDRALLDHMVSQQPNGLSDYGLGFMVQPLSQGRTLVGHGGGGPYSGIDGMNGIVWETGWSFSLLGNYDAPFAGVIAGDIAALLARVA
jgi:D-alanyl-D-alanine carboxypeptidase